MTQSKHLLVCDQNNHRIQGFELDGKFVFQFGTNGSKLGEFNYPFSVAVLTNDQIVVCDNNNHRIQIFDNNIIFQRPHKKSGEKSREVPCKRKKISSF